MSDLIRVLEQLPSAQPTDADIQKMQDIEQAMLEKAYECGRHDAAQWIEERKRGEWQITHAYPHNVHCSVCHKRFAQTHWAVWEDGSLPRNYCPNCGADMREGNQ